MKTFLSILFSGLMAFAQTVIRPPASQTQTGATLPGTCAVGATFFDTAAQAGNNLYGCTSANTWTLLAPSSGMLPASALAGEVAEYRLDEQNGNVGYNSIYAHTPTNNLLGNNLLIFSEGSGTNTANYANNRDGIQIANRLQLSGAGNIDYLTLPAALNNGQTYTISMDVISNTGAAQTFRMGTIYQGAISNNMTVGTSWTRLAYTFTATGNSLYVIVYTDAAGDALDFSYDRLQLEFGATPSAWDSHLWNLQMGQNKMLADATTPTWSSPWLVFTGGQKAWGLGNWAPMTLTTMSAYVVVQQTSDATPDQPVFANDYGTFGMWANYGNPGANLKFYWGSAFAQPNCPVAGCIRIGDGNPHVLAMTYDGTTLRAYVDAILVGSTVASVPPVTLTDLELGRNMNLGTGPYFYNGKIGYASLYNQAHSAAQVKVITSLLDARMGQLGVTIPAWRNLVLFEGDSITAGAGGGANFPWTSTVQAAITPFPQGFNTAVAGSTLAAIASRETTDNALVLPAPTRNVLVLLVGANDAGDAGGPAGFVAALKAYCQYMKSQGWNKIVLQTITPQTTANFNTFRDAANALIVADNSFYDGLVRLDLDPIMGCDACASNATYFADGIHPTAAGGNLIAADVVPVLKSVLQ